MESFVGSEVCRIYHAETVLTQDDKTLWVIAAPRRVVARRAKLDSKRVQEIINVINYMSCQKARRVYHETVPTTQG